MGIVEVEEAPGKLPIHNRNRGLNEGLLTNQIVDNHPLFFGIEAGTTAASIALSYLFNQPFPVFAIVGLWALAFIRWPQDARPQP